MNVIKNIFAILLVSITFSGIAQTSKKYTEINFRVEGNCGMCEKRIENALDIKGVKLADWNVKTKNCRVVFKNTVITEEEIHKIIAKEGHTTEMVKATKEDYDNLHGCCKY